MSEQESGQVSGQVSEQEKEAIENTKKKIKATQKGLEKGKYYGERFNLEQEIKREQTLLNLIRKLQKENTELKEEKERAVGLYAQASLNVKSLNGMVNELDNKVKLKDKAIEELQKENQQIKDINVELNTDVSAWKTTTKELQKENEELEKTIDLIIDDFQMENYFVGMTNKEVREYYKKRKELKE